MNFDEKISGSGFKYSKFSPRSALAGCATYVSISSFINVKKILIPLTLKILKRMKNIITNNNASFIIGMEITRTQLSRVIHNVIVGKENENSLCYFCNFSVSLKLF